MTCFKYKNRKLKRWRTRIEIIFFAVLGKLSECLLEIFFFIRHSVSGLTLTTLKTSIVNVKLYRSSCFCMKKKTVFSMSVSVHSIHIFCEILAVIKPEVFFNNALGSVDEGYSFE